MPPKHPLFNHPELLTATRLIERGWTREQIYQLKPDQEVDHPLRAGQRLRLYHLRQIEPLERQLQIRRSVTPALPKDHGANRRAEERSQLLPAITAAPPIATEYRAVRLESLTIGGMQLRGEVQVIYLPNQEGGRALRIEGQSGFITTPGQGRGTWLGRAVDIRVTLP